MKTRQPILVTGSHRSGTTWTGKMLSVASDVGYIHEPFNVDIRMGVNPEPFKFWFTCLDDANSDAYRDILRDIVAFKYPLLHNAAQVRTASDLVRLVKDQTRSAFHRLRNDRPLVKDPIAFFSSEWLAKRFDMQVVVLIRHPAAFCSSLKIMDWTFDFNHFLRQPLLMEKYLSPFKREIEDFARSENDIVDQGILLWNCIHSTMNTFREKHTDWIFVRHEDLALDPCKQFRLLYETLDLEFTQDVKTAIEEASGVHNPVEQVPGKPFKRDSRKSINNWRNRLIQSEIERIRLQTTDLGRLFYADTEW